MIRCSDFIVDACSRLGLHPNQRDKLMDNLTEFKPRIVVVGVGGGGCNAVNNMIDSELEGAEFWVCNTDAQHLEHTRTENRIQLGATLTKGLGAGSKPEIGRAAADESIDTIVDKIRGANMVFITAGMGGGTGTGAAPVIARSCRENGILTVGVVSKPFDYEGQKRALFADQGIEEMKNNVDTLIVIPNQNLFRVGTEKTSLVDALKMADDVLYQGVRAVTDLMVKPGLINLDFNDISTVMTTMGRAMMGTGEAQGENRAKEAAESAISNPLLDDVIMNGARSVLVNITGSSTIGLFEVDEIANCIRKEIDEEAEFIFGCSLDESLGDAIRVSVVATGIEDVGSKSFFNRPPIQPQTTGTAHLNSVSPDNSDPLTPPTETVSAPEQTGTPDITAADVVDILDGKSHAPVNQPTAEDAKPIFQSLHQNINQGVNPPEASTTLSETEDNSLSPIDSVPIGETYTLNPEQGTSAVDITEQVTDSSSKQKKGIFDFFRKKEAQNDTASQVALDDARDLNVTESQEEPPFKPVQTEMPVFKTSVLDINDIQNSEGRVISLSETPDMSVESAPSQTEGEDELEIPAFLRRQAN